MNAPKSDFPAHGSWIAGIALMSLLVPLSVTVVGSQPGAVGAGPADLSSYGPTVVALGLGIVFAVSVVVLNRSLTPAWLRWLSVGLAGCGEVLAIFLLVGLIGTCGLVVLGGTCTP